MREKATITDELAEFLRSGLSIVVATRDDKLEPDGAPVWGVVVDDDRTHLTIFLNVAAGKAVLKNLERHQEIAVVFDKPSTHRACQAKGVFTNSRPAKATERREILRQVESFRNDLEQIGIPMAMTEAWKPWPCLGLQFRVTELFEQTPGPGTGGPLK